MTRRSRAIRSCSRPSWAAGTARNQARLARTIRDRALPGGGWSQYPGGPADLSVSCLSYFALKVVGDDADAPHMRGARDAILAMGGADRANTYTRYHLALFGQYPWRALPAIPPEMIFLPGRGAVQRLRHVELVADDLRPAVDPVGEEARARAARRARRPASCFTARPAAIAAPAPRSAWGAFFSGVDRALKVGERLPGAATLRERAVARAAAWMIARFEGSDGLSAILPAMSNAAFALTCLGHREDHPLMREALAALDGLLLDGRDGALRMQPCLSPVWDTVLAGHALAQARRCPPAVHDRRLARAASWLLAKQTNRPGDWARRNPAPPGGWYFEHRNESYPDVDDTCMALMVLRQVRADAPEAMQAAAIGRGLAWMLGMQNRDGGWASFDRGNDKAWLTQVPFADHNAMIDPSTADITGRVLECLGYFPGFDAAPSGGRACAAVSAPRPDQRRRLVRTLGRQLHLRHLAGAARDGLHRRGHVRATRAPRRSLAARPPEPRRRLGREHRQLHRFQPGRRGPVDAQPDRLGCDGSGRGGRGAQHRRPQRHSPPARTPGRRRDLERSKRGPAPAFPKVFYLGYQLYPHTFPLMALAQYRRATAMSEARGASRRP